jgi:hypothetical protein
MKKLFGELEISWKALIIFAVICGVITGVIAMIPALDGTSFENISITFECWILFAIIIIINSKSPLDSALKTFVFFLISQPLVYLVQVPVSPLGFGIFTYYRGWFIWTLFTFPMAWIGHYMKKDKWWGLLILTPMLAFLGIHYAGFMGKMLAYFPLQLLSVLFCAVTLIIYPLFIFKDKKIRIAGVIISIIILIAGSAYGIATRSSHYYSTSLLSSGSETSGIEFDDSYSVSLEDESFGDVRIGYEEGIESYMVYATFKKMGDTAIILQAPDGTRYVYDITVGDETYDIKARK